MGHPLFRTKNIDKILRDAETMAEDPHAGAGLKRVLTLRDLTFFGIAAIIGAGSFSSLGRLVIMAVPVLLCYLLFVQLPVVLRHCVIQSLPAAFLLPAVLILMRMHRLGIVCLDNWLGTYYGIFYR